MGQGARWFLGMILSLSSVASAQTAASGSGQPENYSISVDVPLVELHATVWNSNGVAVSGLSRENVQVFENGKPQTVKYFQQEDVPITAGIVVDHSGSMGPKIMQVIAAAETFARASNPQDQMFVVNFNENVSLGLPPGVPFTDDPTALQTAINSFPTTGRTALYDAVIEGIRKLSLADRKEKVLILISDGGDNASTHTMKDVIEAAEKSDAIIYCIGLVDPDDIHQNPGLLKKLARNTGGEAWFPTEARELVSICAQIAKDIRAQYTIGYVPADSRKDSTYRKIRVLAHAPSRGKLEVRTRAGYYATPSKGTSRAPSP